MSLAHEDFKNNEHIIKIYRLELKGAQTSEEFAVDNLLLRLNKEVFIYTSIFFSPLRLP